MMRTLKFNQPFETETGAVLPGIEIAYNTWGSLNSEADNVIWVSQLTAR